MILPATGYAKAPEGTAVIADQQTTGEAA